MFNAERHAAAELEALGRIATRLDDLSQRMTAFAALTRGLAVNDVLWSGTAALDANGRAELNFEVPFASISVGYGGAGSVLFGPSVTDGQGSGPGIFACGPSQQVTMPTTGRRLGIVGLGNWSPGDLLSIAVLARPAAPATSPWSQSIQQVGFATVPDVNVLDFPYQAPVNELLTDAPLAADGVYTSPLLKVGVRGVLNVLWYSDQATSISVGKLPATSNAAGEAQVQSWNLPGNVEVQIVATNGATAQTAFDLWYGTY